MIKNQNEEFLADSNSILTDGKSISVNYWMCIKITMWEKLKYRLSNLSFLILPFYFRATLGVKDVLQSSKFSTLTSCLFFILHHSQSLKMCFRKNVCMCVCVSVRLSLWPSPNVEPKPMDRSRSNSIYIGS